MRFNIGNIYQIDHSVRHKWSDFNKPLGTLHEYVSISSRDDLAPERMLTHFTDAYMWHQGKRVKAVECRRYLGNGVLIIVEWRNAF